MHAHSTRSGTVGHSANRLNPRTSAPPPNNEVSQYTPHGLLRTYGPEPRRITSGSTASTYSRPPKTTDQRPGPRTSSVVAECHERIYESSPASGHECGGDAHECGHRGNRQQRQRVDARTIHRKVSDPDVADPDPARITSMTSTSSTRPMPVPTPISAATPRAMLHTTC